MSTVAVVTGGYGVLAQAVADALTRDGWQVALVDRAANPQTPVAGTGMLALGGVDLAEPAAARAAFAAVAERFGGIDALINVAGGFRWAPFEEGTPEDWAFQHRINLQTAVEASRAALPHLRRRGWGRIVNIGARAALQASAGLSAYAASKSGVHRLTESLADELKDSGITVNAVLPSIIDTPANRASMPDADHTRWVSPDALAAVVAFLASDAASAVTGALIPVTGRV